MPRDRDPERRPQEGAEGRAPNRGEADAERRPAAEEIDPQAGEPRRLSGRDVRRLVFATYRASLPYFLVFLLVMALATWFVTEVLF